MTLQLIISSFSHASFTKGVLIRGITFKKTFEKARHGPRVNLRRFHSSKSISRAERVVLISKSDVIFNNLALEEWLYENQDFASKQYLLMWRNRPAIVSGRHQNPWLEANIPLATSLGIDIARRSSGGGTVYHDQGNLNISFLKSRESYNRRKNLDLVVQAITFKWDIDLTVNERDDILLNKLYKVSGTAAKLGRLQSYHHFTLLHSVDQQLLQQCLTSPMLGASSKATKSFPASVMNLTQQEPDMTFDSLIHSIGEKFLAETGQKIDKETFQSIDPMCEDQFPGVGKFRERLQTWEWRFGKTPDFSIVRNFTGKHFKSHPYSVQVKLSVGKGALSSVAISLDCSELEQLSQLITQFCENNTEFLLLHENVKEFETRFSSFFLETNNGNDQYTAEAAWILKCILSCLDFL